MEESGPSQDKLRRLSAQLATAKAECATLEATHAEHAAVLRACKQLQLEMQSAQQQLKQVQGQLASAKTARSAQGGLAGKQAGAITASSSEAEQTQRIVDSLKKRKATLLKLKAKCDDPLAAMKEEEQLALLTQEHKRLERERQQQQRELAQKVRQVTATQAQVERERVASSQGETSSYYEEYLHRLRDMEKSARDLRDKSVAANAAKQEEWQSWLLLLTNTARKLQARADAGEEGITLGDTPTPAASVMESLQKMQASQLQLRSRLKACDEQEPALVQKLRKLEEKIRAHEGKVSPVCS